MSDPAFNIFDRWKPKGGRTIAHRLFEKDLSEVNDFGWHGQGVVHNAVNTILAQPDAGPIDAVLHYGADLGVRSKTPIGHAKGRFAEVENWIRLSSVVCTASLFELFVRRTISLSLRSDPGLVVSKAKAVDGVELLKRGTTPDFRSQVKSCTEGTWSSREIAIGKVFGRRINAIFDNVGALQRLQDLRNSVAHDFARVKSNDFWYIDPTQAISRPVTRMTARKLQDILRVVSLVANELERTATSHIGAFELFLFWNQFKNERHSSTNVLMKEYDAMYRAGQSKRILSTYCGRMSSGGMDKRYATAFIRHYDRA